MKIKFSDYCIIIIRQIKKGLKHQLNKLDEAIYTKSVPHMKPSVSEHKLKSSPTVVKPFDGEKKLDDHAKVLK